MNSGCTQLLLSGLLSISILLELHGYFIKTSNIHNQQSEVLAFGNWVIYTARILHMLFAFALAIALEDGFQLQLSVIFSLAFTLGTIASIFYINFNIVEIILNKIFGWILFMPFPDLCDLKFWRPIDRRFSCRWIAMITSSALAYLALIMPFFVARTLPEYRMSSVYLGQIFTFGSTIILLSMIEPKMMSALDQSKFPDSAPKEIDDFIYARVWLTGILAISCVIWIFFSVLRLE